MKLIDILVQDLPGLGGWPKDKTVASHGPNNCVMFHELGVTPFVYAGLKFEGNDIVTKEEYEAELAANKPEWDGDGLPPAGVRCEFISNDTSWGEVDVIGNDGDKVVFKPSGETYYGIAPSQRQIFRPIRSEADKKKEEAEKAIADSLLKDGDFDYAEALRLSTFVYGSISRNEIPHVSID